MRRYDIPVAPVLVGMILGPLAEQQFRRALAISQGDLSIFVTPADLGDGARDHRAGAVRPADLETARASGAA